MGDSSFRWSVNIFIPLVRWGGALVVGVNILVLPESSERQLRQTLVTSLDHIAIFLHLIAKTYTLTITDEVRKVRDGLNQSIRVSGLPAQWSQRVSSGYLMQADFGLLNAKAEAATIEINWSRWSTEDYNAIITQTRKMQLGLIAMYSSLVRTDETDSIWSCQGDSPLFRERFLPSTIGPFHRVGSKFINLVPCYDDSFHQSSLYSYAAVPKKRLWKFKMS